MYVHVDRSIDKFDLVYPTRPGRVGGGGGF